MKQLLTSILLVSLGVVFFGGIYFTDVYQVVNDENNETYAGEIESNSSLVCVSNLQLSLDASGIGVLTPDMLLAETYPSYDQFEVSITTPPLFTDTVDCSLIGQTVMAEVLNTNTNQKCWSSITVEDKLAPFFDCDTIDVSCTFDIYYDDIDSLLPNLVDNCTPREELIVSYAQQQITQNCQSDYVLILDRSWYVEDEYGNFNTCNQIIRLERPLISEVEFPENDTLYCPNNDIDPAITGFPTLEGEEISFLCGLAAWEDDVIIPKCGNTFKVMRTWTVADWCSNTMRTELQEIIVLDTLGPDFACPNDQTISNSPNLCGAMYTFPEINATDSCSDSQDISVLFFVNNVPYEENDNIFLDIGISTIEVIVADDCNVSSSCEYEITVADTEGPTVVCGDVVVSLNNSGIAEVTPFTYPSFSYTDNCFVEEVTIRRMTTNCNQLQDLDFGPSIEFCCADIGEVVMVELQAIDSSGNIGLCMFEVEVQDKLPPVFTNCPDSISIECTDVTQDLSNFGEPDISDNCEFTSDYTEDISLDGCKEGTITRKWVARDSSGNMDSCVQVITVVNPDPGFDPNTIQWPDDTVISICNIDPQDIITEVTFPQTLCETVSVSFTDMGISPDSACFDIMRVWEVVDSCTGTIYDSVQMIRILNNRPPVLTVPNDMSFSANGNCQAAISLPSAFTNDCNTGVVITNNFTSQGPIVDTIFDIGTTTIIYTAVDSCDNEATAETIINVVDDTPPEVDCPNDTSVSNDPGLCGAFIEFIDPKASDNCGIDSVFVDFTDSTNASGFYPVGNTEVTIIVFDEAGLSDTCSFNVEVIDDEAPSLFCSQDTLFLFLDAFCEVEIPPVNGLINYSDNCTEVDSIIVSQVPAVGDTLMMVQDTTITVTVTDSSGNSATCEIVVATRDTLPPDIMCPHLDTLDVFVDQNCAYELEDFTSEAILMSNCTDTMDIEVTQSPLPGTSLQGSDTVYIITLSAEDASGNAMSCSFPIQLLDNISPQITCPVDIAVSTDPGVCEAMVDITVPAPTDNCGVDTFFNSYNLTEDASGIYPEGTTTVIYTVIDESGNETTCSFTVTVEDNEAPVLDCPLDSMITLNANCEALIPDVSGWVTYSDNCTEFDSIDFTQSPPVDSMIAGVQNIDVVVTVTDSSGNSSTCVIDISFEDETAPDLTCPNDIEVSANDTCSYVIEDFTAQAIVTDNCSNSSSIVVTQSPQAGETFDGVGTYEITLTATDESDNSTTCTFEVEVIDDTDPQISCPVDIEVSTDPGVCEAMVDITVPAPSDNCGVDTFFNNYNLSEDASDVYPLGTTEVIYTVIDESGNETTCSFTVTVEDNEAPLLDCPQDSMITLDANCEALIPDVSGWVSYSDNCTEFDSIAFTQSPPVDSLIVGVQNIDVIVTVRDSSGNSATCVIDIAFEDNTAPSLTCPNDIEVPANDTCSYVIEDFRGQAIVTDNCSNSSSIVVTQSPSSGETFDGVGTYEITLTATDESDNSTTCTFEVEVIDDTDPQITCPVDIEVSTDPGVCEAMVDITVPTPTDNCGVDTFFNNYNLTEDASDVYPEGTTTVIYTVIDESGNETTCSFTVTVEDNEAPLLDCPQDSMITLDANCEALIPDVSGWVTYSDNCTEFDSIEFTQSPPVDSLIVGVQNIDVIVTVRDSSGNSATCVVDIAFEDNTAPEITCPADIEVSANDTCSYLIGDFTGQAIVTDNCSNSTSIVVTQFPSAGETFDGVGTYEITLTATDESDNSTTCTFEVELIDDTAPEIACPGNIVVSTDPGVCEAMVDITVPAPTDNCGVDTFFNNYNLTEDASDVYPEGTTTVIYTVIDVSGNETTCSFTVTVEDNEAPVLDCPQDSTIALDMNCEAMIPDVSGWVTYSDNCTEFDSIEFTQSPPADSIVEGAQDIELIVTVTDSAGNISTCEITLTFTDTLPVSIICPPDTSGFFDGNCEYILPDFRDSATIVSSCTDPDSLIVTQIPAEFSTIDGSGVGDTTLEVTLIVELNGGSSDTCMFNVEIMDTIPAQLFCAPDTSIFVNEDCEGIIPDLTPELSVEDNCIDNIGFTATQDPAAGEIFSAGDTITISYTVFVDNGDTLTCESELIVLDSIAPGISCPQNTNLFLGGDCAVSIPDFTSDIVLNPGCADSLEIEVVQLPLPGDYPSFDGEEIEISLVATNPNNGEADTCTFIVTTQDTISPDLQCSGNTILLDLDEDCEATIPDVTAEVISAEDNCTAEQDIQITQIPVEGTVIVEPENPIEVEIIADDGNGNTTSCFITVDFQDVTPPTLICPPDTMVPCQFDIDSTEQYGEPTAFDSCSNVTITTTTQFFSSNLCTVDSLIRTFVATDEAGNSATCQQRVIFEGANPDLTEDDFIFVDTVFTEDCELTEPGDIPGSIPELDPNLDVCKVINTSFEDGATRDSDFGCKEFDRTWTLIDSCANLSNPNEGIFTFEQLVVINDTVSPEIVVPFQDTIIYIDSCGTMAEIDFAPATASDCVGIDTLFNDSPFADSNSGGDISGTYEEGTYEITISAQDSCGNLTEETINLVVSDTSDLEFSCVFKVEKPFDTVTLMVPFFVSELADGIVNSCGNIPAGDINFAVDPNDINDTVIIVTCEDFGPGGTEFVDSVPVYAFIDGVLVDSCETIIAITDNVIDCMIEALPGEVVDVNAHPFEDVEVDLSGTSTSSTSTDEDGGYVFEELMHGGYYSVKCDYEGSPVAGVSTFDLLLIQRHILGLSDIVDPYGLIAADVDKNQRITGGDIIHLRRVILGIDSEMPVDNWRFIPEDFVFISPEWAHASNYPEEIQIESLTGSVMSADFIGLKVGDVDGSISPEARGRSGQEIWTVKYGEDDRLEFFAPTSGKVYGFQFELPAEYAKNTELLDGQIKWEGFEIGRELSGKRTVSWSDPYGQDMRNDKPLFSLKSLDGAQIEPFTFSRDQLVPEIYREGEVQIRSLSLRWSAGTMNYALHQNRPNPFMDRTIIPFELPKAEDVELSVHDNSGRLIYTEKISGKAGYNQFELHANSLRSSGQYHYTLKADNFVGSKVLILSKP